MQTLTDAYVPTLLVLNLQQARLALHERAFVEDLLKHRPYVLSDGQAMYLAWLVETYPPDGAHGEKGDKMLSTTR